MRWTPPSQGDNRNQFYFTGALLVLLTGNQTAHSTKDDNWTVSEKRSWVKHVPSQQELRRIAHDSAY